MQAVNALTETQAAELLQKAREASLRARRAEALDLLDGCGDWPSPFNEQALLQRAEALSLQDPISALQELAAHADAFASPQGRIEYLLMSARVYTRARNFDAAQAMLDEAQAAIEPADDGNRCLLGYARARLQWSRREYDPQSEDLALALRSADPAVRFDALNLRAWMHAGLEDYRAQLNDSLECIRLFAEFGYRCGLTSVAMCLQTTLAAAWELHDPQAARQAEAALERIDWTPEIQVYRFLCLRALAWHAFLEGDSARAQWLFKDSKDFAPTPAWKVMAHVDRAYVARINLNDAWAAEELHEAHVIARTIDWHATRDEERMALITLAVLFAPTDLGHAQRYVSTYIELGEDSLNPSLAASHNPRRSIAYREYGVGRVQAMLGHKALATRSLEHAYEIFSAIGYDFRAAMAAQALLELTGDSRWLENARAHAAKFPASALARRLNESGSGTQEADLHGLTPLQRQIAVAYCHGVDVTELSRRFSRSSFTIGKQIEAIYAAFGVRSRTALRDELQRRNML